MTMQTDKLIQALAADHGRRSKSLYVAIAVALVGAAPFAVGMFAMRLGIRQDIAVVATSPFFLLKFATTLALFMAAGLIVMRLARPAQPVGWSRWLLALPLILLAAGIVGDLSIDQQRSWAERLIGNNARVCLMAIPMLSLPFLVAALLALRQGASTRPAATGAAAGLFASAIGATLYAAHCGDDSPLFIVVWYVIAVAIVAAAGALAGKWLLRF